MYRQITEKTSATKKTDVFIFIVFLATTTSVLLISPTSILSLLYFFVLTLISSRFLVGSKSMEPVRLYVIYSGAIVVFYLIQLWSYPEYFGFSGGLGIGTDDAQFYAQVAAWFPPAFPVRSIWVYPYAQLIRVVTWWYEVKHPLDVLFFNAIPLVLIPPLTYRVAFKLSGQREVGNTAYWLIACCPFVLSNSLILVRDGWTALTMIGAVYSLTERSYIKMTLLVALAAFLRIGSALMLVAWLMVFIVLESARSKMLSRAAISLVAIAGFVVAARPLAPYVEGYLIDKGVYGTLFRADFVSFVETSVQASASEDSIALWLYRQSPAIRIPLAFVYYFLSPFFTPTLVQRGIFIPRALLSNIFAILSVFYLQYFVRGLFHAWNDRETTWKVMILAFLASVLLLSQLSLQIRHKVMLMPVFYILVAYGYHSHTERGALAGSAAGFLSATAQVVRSLLRII